MTAILKFADYYQELQRIARHGMARGSSPGWPELEKFYRLVRGYLSVITGIPGHGKSEWLDALMVNLAWKYGWHFAVFSPENYPIALHAIKLAEKKAGCKYDRVAPEEKHDAMLWVDEHFTFLYPPEDKCTLPDILQLADQVRSTYGADGLVIDPWNEIDHRRPEGLTETEYISRSLSMVRRFAREKEVHCWMVAHPAKLQKNKAGKYDPPTPYDISGSAHWRNKADFCITVHRPDIRADKLEIIVNKVKFKHFGKIGKVELRYDPESGRMRATGDIGFKLPEKAT